MMARSRRGFRLFAVMVGLSVCLGGAALVAQDEPPAGDGMAMPGKASKAKAKPKKGAAKTTVKKGDLSSKKADSSSKKEEVKAVATAEDDAKVKFSRDVAPVLAANCIRCHNAQQRKGQLDISTFQKLLAGSAKHKIIEAGKPDDSELLLRVKGESDGPKMPPGQNNLGPEAIAKIEEWIKAGALLDKGFEPTATLESIAPTPEARRQEALKKMSSEDRDKKVEAVALERWKKASAKDTPVTVSSKNFLLFSTMKKERGERLLKAMEAQRNSIGNLLGPAHSGSLSGLEKISIYVFTDLTSYVEFIRSNENREVEQGIEAHGRLDVEQPYLAAADPLNGRDEPVSATPKKAPKSKKSSASDETNDGPDRTLAGLLSEQLASSALVSGGKPPRWLVYGFGAFVASQVDPRGSGYYRKLREEAAAQYQLGWVAKANEALGGEGAPETIRAVGFSLCEFLATTARPKFPYFVQGMLAGGEKLDEVTRGCFGDMVTREEFLNEWGGYIVSRYGAGRRR